MIKDKIEKYFRQEIVRVVISNLKKGAECEYSKVTIKPYNSSKGIMYQFEYTVKTRLNTEMWKNITWLTKSACCWKIISHSVWFTAPKAIIT